MTISGILQQLSSIKSGIKSALQGLGINMSNVPFTEYGSQISSIVNRGAVNQTITPSESAQSYTIPKGYHNGNGKVTVGAAPLVTSNTSAVIKGNTGSSATITIGSKVICISGASSMWEVYTLTLKATIDGSSVTLTNDNGTLVEDFGYGSGAGRRAKQLMWINNKTYKNSTFTNATISGTDGDSTSCISAVKY